jgi:hypothetical protein
MGKMSSVCSSIVTARWESGVRRIGINLDVTRHLSAGNAMQPNPIYWMIRNTVNTAHWARPYGIWKRHMLAGAAHEAHLLLQVRPTYCLCSIVVSFSGRRRTEAPVKVALISCACRR